MFSLEEVVQRIDSRLKVVGKSAAGASREAGLSEDAIRNLRRAARGEIPSKGLNVETLVSIAKALEISSSWLLGEDEDSPPPKLRRVPIVGHVGAGSEAYFVPAGLGTARAPEWATGSTVAVVIRGDSLGRTLNGWLAYYDDVRRPVTTDLMGKLCVVGLADGRILIKQIRKARQKGYFHLFSETEEPILDVEVEWAARVKALEPK